MFLYHIHLLISFCLRTTKIGGLSNISYIKRKPELLGTKFSNIVDGIGSNLIWLEIQEDVDLMKTTEF